MTYDIPTLTSEAVGLLKSLISIPSVSRDEARAADCLQQYIEQLGMQTGRKGNNVWCLGPGFDLSKACRPAAKATTSGASAPVST